MRMVCSQRADDGGQALPRRTSGEVEDETAAAGHAFCHAGLHGAGRDALSRLSDNDAQYGGSQSVSVKNFTSNH